MSATMHGTGHDSQLQSAMDVMQRAYAPYSQFRVGATLVAADGTEFHGCNVENSSYPAGICAERSALSAAVAAGHRRFSLLVVATEATEPTLHIVSATADGARMSWRLSELLPVPFTPASLAHR